MTKIRILALCPYEDDGCSFYRGAGPLAALEKQVPNIHFEFGGDKQKDYNWARIARSDILFVQRPALPAHSEIIQVAKAMGKPVWVDYDDDLLSIPKENPAHKTYAQFPNQVAIMESLRMANVVTVSTDFLKTKLERFNANTRVVKNAWNDSVFKFSEPPQERKKIVLWRGTPSHAGDLYEFRKPILELTRDFPDWKWVFYGYDPIFITREMKPDQYQAIDVQPIFKYYADIQKLSAPIQIVPLADNDFNRAKSNIAWIEGTWAGSAVVAPSWAEWNVSGMVNYSNMEDFRSSLAQVMNKNVDYQECQKKSWAEVPYLSVVNQERAAIVEGLIRGA